MTQKPKASERRVTGCLAHVAALLYGFVFSLDLYLPLTQEEKKVYTVLPPFISPSNKGGGGGTEGMGPGCKGNQGASVMKSK